MKITLKKALKMIESSPDCYSLAYEIERLAKGAIQPVKISVVAADIRNKERCAKQIVDLFSSLGKVGGCECAGYVRRRCYASCRQAHRVQNCLRM